jgi:P27 family predicted phage terminase small subunit
MQPEPPPDWLSTQAQDVWRDTSDELPIGADLAAFAVYCCTMADFLQAQQTLDKTGQLIRGPNGGLIPSPLNRIKLTNANAARALARDLGIGAAASLPPAQSANRSIRHRNQSAIEKTIKSLTQSGRLEGVDSATISVARSMAEALDRVDPETKPAQYAACARVQLAALRMLRGSPDDDDDASSLADQLAALSAEMGDAPQS